MSFQVCFGSNISPVWAVPGAGVEGTVDGAVDDALAVGRETAGGGKSGAAGMLGRSKAKPLSAPGGEVLGVGALDGSGESDDEVFLLG